jgi:hypothetical protein
MAYKAMCRYDWFDAGAATYQTYDICGISQLPCVFSVQLETSSCHNLFSWLSLSYTWILHEMSPLTVTSEHESELGEIVGL